MQSRRRKNIVKLIDNLIFHRDATVSTAQYFRLKTTGAAGFIEQVLDKV